MQGTLLSKHLGDEKLNLVNLAFFRDLRKKGFYKLRIYLPYFILLVLILTTMVVTRGEANKTIMYSITLISVAGLTLLKSIEKRKK